MKIHVCQRGTDAGGLMRYLYGGGKVDEHTNQHMVASSESLLMEWGGALSDKEATQLGRVVEASWRHQFADQLAVAGVGAGGISRSNLTGATADKGGESKHIYHVAMALSPGDTALTDEQWAQVATDYVDQMGFSDGGPGVGARWVAVRHGLTLNGGDHVHLVVELVRQDGELCDTRNDWHAAVRLGEEFEHTYDFLRVTKDATVEAGPAVPGYTPAEARRAKERVQAAAGPADPDRVHLQRVVRGAVQVAATEAEWIGAVLDANVDIEPRWAPGGRDQVVGYTVALDSSAASGEVVRFGGSKLASDLTLTKLRTRWASAETDESHAAAMSLWRGETDLGRPAAPPSPRAELRAAAQVLSGWNERLDVMDVNDRAGWKREAAHAAGTMSLLASRGGQPVPPPGRVGGVSGAARAQQLGAVADQLTRSGPAVPLAARSGLTDGEILARHVNLALRAGGLDSARGWAAVLQQMSRTTTAIARAHEARGELVAAQRLLAGAPVVASFSATVPVDAPDTSLEANRAAMSREQHMAPHANRGPRPSVKGGIRDAAGTDVARERDTGYER